MTSSARSPYDFGALTDFEITVFQEVRKIVITRHVRGFCIATGQYSSFCVCALGLKLGVLDHMEDDDQDREDEEVREVVETTRERKRSKHGETTNKQTRDDMWMKIFFMSHALRHLEPQCGINTCVKGA